MEEDEIEIDNEGHRVPDDVSQFATGFHAPVLCKIVTEELVTEKSGVYVDATLGGGGHTAALLEYLSEEGQVIGIDRDPEALETTRLRLDNEIARGRLSILQGDFGDLERLLRTAGFEKVDGVLVDLGVSSHQVDTPERGFSYTLEGHLDMRMNVQSGKTAYDIVNDTSLVTLRGILSKYGEEPRSARIAAAIVRSRPIETTRKLAEVIKRVIPSRETTKTLARVFQGIRIMVNNELEELESVLAAGVRVIRQDGRMLIISYHSLEDRRVKRFFRYGNIEGLPVHDVYGNLITPWRELTRKPVTASAAEVQTNPRARSARVRYAARTEYNN